MRRRFPLALYIRFDDEFNNQQESLYPLTAIQAKILRKLVGSVRRFQFYSEINGEYYTGISDEQWDVVRGVLDDADYRLTLGDETVGEIAVSLSEIADSLRLLATCLCKQIAQQSNSVPQVLDTLSSLGITVTNDDIPDPQLEITCMVANTIYGVIYELITETIFPAIDATSDVVLAVVEASALLDVISGGVGLPATIVLGLIALLINVLEDVAFSQLQNAMIESQEELICAIFKDGVDGTVTVIDGMDTAKSNKALLKFLFTKVGRLIAVGIMAGRVTPRHYIDCDCDGGGTYDFLLDGHFGSGDFVSDIEEDGFYASYWPNWLASRVCTLTGSYTVTVEVVYGPSPFIVRAKTAEGWPFFSREFAGGQTVYQFDFGTSDAFYIELSPSVVVKRIMFAST